MPTITPEVYTSMGLNAFEYEKVLELLGREPSLTELGMFAVMWSEHCGYKYSRPVLALFSKYKEALEGKGFENAGVVDIGDGLGVTMKIESHNHPSAVEPYQGAATGVGGIIRDILTMGARPIASLNSLRFGPITEGEAPLDVVQRNRYLFEHVVAGIAGYGNCVGVPTVGGEVSFHPRYSGNPLVNAMCVGMLRLDEVTTAAASGAGNPVIYLGSATGKDGIHGATFASDALGEDSEAKRPNVQIGDPFAEKLLIEATLEALQTGAVVAIQDMGAAGLTCSTVEMASKGEVGIEIDLDKVPMRESDMSAYELMLSESQERMLAVAVRGREQEVLDVFRKWGLKAEIIGWVTDDGETTVKREGATAAHLDARLLTDFCPTYTPDFEVPAYFEKACAFDIATVPEADPQKALITLLSAPNIASKKWVYEQYDQSVQTQTILHPGQSDAAVLAPRGSKKGLAVAVDGNGRHVYFDPFVGGQLAVAEAARNVACAGGRPQAITDGLNFGNPQKPHVYWQFKESVRGIAEAAEAMGTPVISGNVSFYNESDLGEVLPTPLIGMLGLLEDATKRLPLAPEKIASSDEGQVFLLAVPLTKIVNEGLGASEYLAAVHGIEDGRPVAPHIAGERALCELLAECAADGLIGSAHDSSDGGLAVSLAEIAKTAALDVDLAQAPKSERVDSQLFGEFPGRVIVTVTSPPETNHLEEGSRRLQTLAAMRGIDIYSLGTYNTSKTGLKISYNGSTWNWSGDELRKAYEESIPQLMRH